ncbi:MULTISPECIES: hypothetical protein [unclassified Streptomyces]|uniref:hypothetical protein n=1 Tax=unclassified Streptomyces TaxID=2593676 RepID=UPI001CEC9711|nr:MULTISPECIES: hypothetical protein [unclassified Streptomyces]
MSTHRHPPLKSITTTPDGPHAAPQPVDTAGVGEPKGAARQGVRTSPDPHPEDPGNPTPDRPGIRIFAPPVYRHPNDGGRWSKRYGSTPTAAYACPCGQTRTATGAHAVAALVADYGAHRSICTGTPAPRTEGRTAA